MKQRSKLIVLFLVMICAVLNVGCTEAPLSPPRFSGLNTIAELATLRCYYHNVAEVRTDGTKLFFDAVVVGRKKAWFEYSGYVDMGVDMTKVHIKKPDANNVVRVEMPTVEVFDLNIDEDTLQMKRFDGGLFQKITFEEIDGAREAAQKKMKKQAEKDRVMLTQAKEHARTLIESYIVNVGESIGQTFTVEFVDSDN